jgi:hypothetical protein
VIVLSVTCFTLSVTCFTRRADYRLMTASRSARAMLTLSWMARLPRFFSVPLFPEQSQRRATNGGYFVFNAPKTVKTGAISQAIFP